MPICRPRTFAGLLSIARRRTFARGEVVFHRDDPADSLHLVVRGRFGARVLTPLGDSVLIDVLGPGQSFGELARRTSSKEYSKSVPMPPVRKIGEI